jgi:signal transduction histidine kinase
MRAGAAAWAVRRLRAPEPRSRRWWLAGLVTSALLGLGGIISISIRLRRGVATVRQGLGKLEEDFHYRLPAVAGDFGSIARAINHMAERRSALETYLRRQDRLAALGKVVAGVAHEIRNPLNSMRLTLELLDRRARKGAVMGDEVAGAIEEVDRLDGILARLLAFGRPGQERRIRQDVRPLIERAVRVVQQQAQAREVALRVETGCAALEAPVDGPQIEQVLINLLLNAIEASPPGGVVSVAAEPREREVRISVRDQGSGISDAVAEHVFDPYFTTKEAGNGLGLAVSREVVLHHAGQLEFQTGPRGTTFVVRLPAGAAS